MQERQMLVPEFKMLATSPLFNPSSNRRMKRMSSQRDRLGMNSSSRDGGSKPAAPASAALPAPCQTQAIAPERRLEDGRPLNLTILYPLSAAGKSEKIITGLAYIRI